MALRQVLEDLVLKAASRNARLTAISSVARGGDVLFAEAVRSLTAPGDPLPWKCLLPFNREDFIRHDLECGPDGQAMGEKERSEYARRAQACLQHSLPAAEVTSPATIHSDPEQREEAYLECGYRIVDEADVMIFLLMRDEFEMLSAPAAPPASAARGAGTFAEGCYARAAGWPMVLLNAEAENIWSSRRMLNVPTDEDGKESWFVDPVVTDIVAQAAAGGSDDAAIQQELVTGLSAPKTPSRESVNLMGAQLGALANRHQGHAQNGYRLVLRFHLAASALAALGATVLLVEHPAAVPAMLLGVLALLALVKPGFAFAAWWLEHRLHHRGTREVWLHARVLGELCRGAVATWPLPVAPRAAPDEEDFPRIKRMIRTLRLLREQDGAAAVRDQPREPHETQLEADMRVACGRYITERLRDQAAYYGRKHQRAATEEHCWRRRFQIATWVAIVGGLALAGARLWLAAGNHPLSATIEHMLEAIIIIAPFVAAHCLGTMTIRDARRRCRRYAELQEYLNRLAETLEHTQANPSRIRLIEHAERTLIEEQHEWFSVMRNLSV